MTIINNTVFNSCSFLRGYILSVLSTSTHTHTYTHTHTQMVTKRVINITLISLIVDITSQCIYISKNQIVHFKYIQFAFINFISRKLSKRKEKKCRTSTLTLGLLIQNVSFCKIYKWYVYMWKSETLWVALQTQFLLATWTQKGVTKYFILCDELG